MTGSGQLTPANNRPITTHPVDINHTSTLTPTTEMFREASAKRILVDQRCLQAMWEGAVAYSSHARLVM